jgi:hypothetical protein
MRNQQVKQSDAERPELGQRLENLAGDEVKPSWARGKVDPALDPHAANATRISPGSPRRRGGVRRRAVENTAAV